ncbi:hypothetical protein FWH30_03120 [Microgenomates group bacterium]|nr:hypothetical protein [Microgenomates group bacterium]
MHKSSVLSPAKLNLGLVVKGKLSNGYHDVNTVLTTLPFYDELLITRTPSGFHLTCSDPSIPTDERNLLFIVYQKMLTLSPEPHGLSVHLVKNIPSCSGLGGGSLNAATFLKYLNDAWKLSVHPKRLTSLAKDIGSDIAFSLINDVVYETKHGIKNQGELIPLMSLPKCSILLVFPHIHISVADAYSLLDRHSYSQDKDLAPLLKALKKHDLSFANFLHNSFETAIFAAYPQLSAIKKFLLSNNALGALLTGKGSCIYGVFTDELAAKTAAAAVKVSYPEYQTWVFNYD